MGLQCEIEKMGIRMILDTTKLILEIYKYILHKLSLPFQDDDCKHLFVACELTLHVTLKVIFSGTRL